MHTRANPECVGLTGVRCCITTVVAETLYILLAVVLRLIARSCFKDLGLNLFFFKLNLALHARTRLCIYAKAGSRVRCVSTRCQTVPVDFRDRHAYFTRDNRDSSVPLSDARSHDSSHEKSVSFIEIQCLLICVYEIMNGGCMEERGVT
ncbi:hypothetical protein KQX54_004629 [Cotesia glomerata]|uniref:Uncharacterized protein n=1 Tax=Cotesia glomerata TaxID=32391 RepID=A0AAV7HXA8_COTGL|nr:hypothetical protein KQX54_004629 [Cotesia glomerata]